VLVFNIGANVPSSILDEDGAQVLQDLERWRAWAVSLTAGEVAKRMVARDGEGHKGTIIFTGATASLRGSANFAAFAGAKHALRALAQSMARELGPRGNPTWRIPSSTAP
jgi:NAD(P)-dependent dehydrogenase (short-subunit alcohol dehydrogenase family)